MRIKILIFSLLLTFIGLTTFVKSYAQDATDSASVKAEYEDVQAEIARLQKQLNSLQSQERTLSNQIIQFNSQMQVTQLQIADTQKQIQQLQAEIIILQSQVDGLEITLEKISGVIADRAVSTYQQGELTPLKLLVTSNGFETFVTKYAYASYLQDYNKRVLLQIQQNQNNINDKKTELEEKRKQIEVKKKQLEALKATLDAQKKAKETLLAVTKNDETRYAKLLEAAKSKEQSLAKLIFRDGKVSYSMGIYGLSKQGSISQGSRIGTMGNSGYPRCTNAAHLHMEVMEKGIVTESAIGGELLSPYAYLKSRTLSFFQDDNSIGVSSFGAGNWNWPLNEPIITQQFGKTPWSSRYLGGYHSGVDMVDYNDKTVRAPASGTLYYAKVNCGSAINIAIIDHGNGVLSDYLHLE
jgi:peptidoglycan hydrolase CwlO-like protein